MIYLLKLKIASDAVIRNKTKNKNKTLINKNVCYSWTFYFTIIIF